MLRKALSRRKARAAVAIASIMVGAAVVSALAALYFDISIKMSQELRAYGANFFVGADPASPDRRFPAARYDAILAEIPADRLTGASPFLYGVVSLGIGNAVLAGVDFEGMRRIYPYWRVEGGWISVAFDDRNAMIGKQLAEKLELQLGATIEVYAPETGEKAELRIKGIIESGGPEDEQMFVSMDLARRLFAVPERIDLAMLSVVAEGDEAARLAETINSAHPEADAKPIRKISQSDGQILDKIEGFMALVAFVILVITTLCVNAIMSAIVVERTPEIGLQKALGADDREIMTQFLSETALICAIGLALGLALGFALAQVLGQTVFGAWVNLRPLVIPLTAFASLAAALIAAIIPIRSAVRIVPARVLKGE
ncbi:hypothetical protein IT41_00280 [Paracoccus halophilus]|uniref:ABC transport system permease protein n=2 Tax=Paracoccus halophilus TaxID=376733 RepID=A0A099F996_9RHOB|nr:hypothetical protein IT41_00280 [Paracoccus halophilus]